MIGVANQQGSSRFAAGIRDDNRFGPLQLIIRLVGPAVVSNWFVNPADMFKSGLFQTAAAIRRVSRHSNYERCCGFSPTVFAIDPFADRLVFYDPSLSIQVAQNCLALVYQFGRSSARPRACWTVQPSSENGEILSWALVVGLFAVEFRVLRTKMKRAETESPLVLAGIRRLASLDGCPKFSETSEKWMDSTLIPSLRRALRACPLESFSPLSHFEPRSPTEVRNRNGGTYLALRLDQAERV